MEQMVSFVSEFGLQDSEKSEIQEVLSHGDLTTAASLCGLLMRKADFRSFLDRVFIKPNPQPHEVHRLLVDLGPDSFITTNYDHLIQDAYQLVHNGLVLFPVNNDQPIEQASIVKHGSSRFIFTPHGCAEKCETVILRREDYRNLRFTMATLETLRNLLVSRPVIYFGFGLQDPDFLMIKDEIAATYRGGEREHFAIIPDVSGLQKTFWKKEYGVSILSYKTHTSAKQKQNHNELLLLLRDLQRTLKAPAPSVPSRKPPSRYTDTYATRMRNSLLRYCETTVHISVSKCEVNLPLAVVFRGDLSPGIDTVDHSGKHTLTFKAAMPVQELFDSVESTILIGVPGSGKTTAITKYAMTLAERTRSKLLSTLALNEKIKHALPVIIPMNEYNGDVKEMIKSRLPRSVDSAEALENGWLVVILDGIDSVPRSFIESKVFANNIRWFMSRFPHNRYIFTSRTTNYLSNVNLPVFELQSLSPEAVERHLVEHLGIGLDDLGYDFVTRTRLLGILKNPLILTIFTKTSKEVKRSYSSQADLIGEYVSTVERKMREENEEFKDIPLRTLLASLAYSMIDSGCQTVDANKILEIFHHVLSLHRLSYSTADDVLKILLAQGVLVPTAEGRTGFFHQSITEYLAACQLANAYLKDTSIMKDKINFFRWDETILLFVALLPSSYSRRALRTISDIDMILACKAFESATFHDRFLGLRLFDLIHERLCNVDSSTAEKEDLAEAMLHLAPYGRKKVLQRLLDDPIMGGTASIFLARMGVKAVTPKISKLLLKDRKWPSDFAKALYILADDSTIAQLIRYGKCANPDELAMENLAEVVKRFESEQLYSEILKLIASKVTKERAFAATILGKLDSTESKELLAKMLFDSNKDVLWRVIFGLEGSLEGIFRHRARGPYKTEEIVLRMLELLKDKNSGHWAAGYLEEIEDDAVKRMVRQRLERSHNIYEKVNIAGLLASESPDTSKEIIVNALKRHDKWLRQPLIYAISSSNLRDLLPHILTYIRAEDHRIRTTVLDALHMSLKLEEELPISLEDCEYLMRLWEESKDYTEKSTCEYLLTDHCTRLSKELFLKRLRDENYPNREDLLEPVSRLPLVRGELNANLIDWLLSNMDYRQKHYPPSVRSPVATILGKVSDQATIKEKIVPLLESTNEVVRSNAYAAIKIAEASLGERLIRS